MSVPSSTSSQFVSSSTTPVESTPSVPLPTPLPGSAASPAPTLSLDAPIQAKSTPFSMQLLSGSAPNSRPSTASDFWLQRAQKNDLSFNDSEVLLLPPVLLKAMYKAANLFQSDAFVARLNDLGMGNKDAEIIESPSILAPNMDSIRVRQTLGAFLVDLRQKGLLLTPKEAGLPEDLKQFTVVESIVDGKSYYCKRNDLGRLLGRMHLEIAIQKTGVDRIKVPKKFLVVNDSVAIASLHVGDNLSLSSSDFTLYAEVVPSIARRITDEEYRQIREVVAAAMFTDGGNPDNFIAAEDGIYFIDTEMSNFASATDYHPVPKGAQITADDFKMLSALFGPTKTEDLLPCRDTSLDALRIQQYQRFGFACQRTYNFALSDFLRKI